MQSEADKRRQHRALRDSEEQYRLLFTQMHEGFSLNEIIVDAGGKTVDFRILVANAAYERHTGLKVANIVGKTIREVMPNADSRQIEIYGDVALTGRPQVVDYFSRTFDRHFRVRIFCPQQGRFATLFEDVTAAKLAEQEKEQRDVEVRRTAVVLQATTDLLRTILSNAPITIFAVDANGVFTLSDGKGLERVGLKPGENVGRSARELFASVPFVTDAGVALIGSEVLRRVLDEGETVVAVSQLGVVAFDNRIAPMRDAQGKITGAVGVATDITERKQLQAQLLQAERLSSMGTLAVGVGHEINNPLTYVLHHVETLVTDLPRIGAAYERFCAAVREKVGPTLFAELAGEDLALLTPASLDVATQRAKEACEGAQRIRDVTRSLSLFSRSESTALSAIELTQPIEAALKMAANEIRLRARVIRDFGEVPAVWASEGRLAQVFLNLLVNAAHAIAEGHADANAIEIRTFAEGDNAFVEVSDTGCGIAPEHLGRVFEPFFTTKDVGHGSGLGLPICRNIVTQFGGDIHVESAVGQGTKVLVRLPVQSKNASTLPATAGAAVVADVAVPDARRGRILVIDDERAICRMMTQVLGANHDVVTATSGREARALLEKDVAFDVIICDLMMAEVTGMELHTWLAKREAGLASRVVFVTGGAFSPGAEAYLNSVTNPRLGKPFEMAKLRSVVAATIEAAQRETRGR